MAAGVHLARMAGAEIQTGFLFDRQRVHIAAKSGGVWLARVEKSQDSAVFRLNDPAVQRRQLRKKIVFCLGQIFIQLRDAVQCPAVSGKLLQYERHLPQVLGYYTPALSEMQAIFKKMRLEEWFGKMV